MVVRPPPPIQPATISLHTTQQTQNICITYIQRRPNVFDIGPALPIMLYTCFMVYTCFMFAG